MLRFLISWIWRVFLRGPCDRGWRYVARRWLLLQVLRRRLVPPPPKKAGHFTSMWQDFDNCGFFETPAEWGEELPRQLTEGGTDSVRFAGGNREGVYLWLEVVRRGPERGEVALGLRLEDGRLLVPPSYPATAAITDGFNSGPLRVSCLSPFRKWRLSFNGTLRELDSKDEANQLHHVKFSLMFCPSSFLYSISHDTDPTLVAESLASLKSDTPEQLLDRFYKSLVRYEQWGMFLGTLQVGDGDERQITFWGVRTRDHISYDPGRLEHLDSYYGRLSNGQCFSSGLTSVKDLIPLFKHGYQILSNRDLHPISQSSIQPGNFNTEIEFTAGDHHKWKASPVAELTFRHGPRWELVSRVAFSRFSCSNKDGYGILSRISRVQGMKAPPLPPLPIRRVEFESLGRVPLVVRLEDEACRCAEVAGGKGASLGQLSVLAAEEGSFTVPRGVVLTTEAYRAFLRQRPKLPPLIDSLRLASSEDMEELKDRCKTVAAEMEQADLPEDIMADLHRVLKEMFGDDLNNIRLAVRSSALGEDDEETSAAGQMTTLLGIRGLDQVCRAVCTCWASQFLLTAVQYKRQHGMPLDPGMAVVVQEMVPATAAGVLFTCHPVSGDPACLTLTANYGLGESVVGASAEPDTILLRRDPSGGILHVEEVKVGKKNTKITMLEETGTVEETVSEEEAQKCCLSEEMAIKLGHLAIDVEEAFNSPRDIEWAVDGDRIFLLQSRPITTLHRESDFDILHELDIGLHSDFEYLTRANVGEVMPGSMCPMTFGLYFKGIEIAIPAQKKENNDQDFVTNPYAHPLLGYISGQAFINIMDFLLRFVDPRMTLRTRVWEIAIFGRLLEKRYLDAAVERYGWTDYHSPSALRTLWNSFKTIRNYDSYYCTIKEIDYTKFSTAVELHEEIKSKLPPLFESIYYHTETTEASSVFNNIIMETLADHYDSNIEEIMKDVAILLSSCSNVESADVPAALEDIAVKIIKYNMKETFINMDPKSATKLLQEDKGPVGQTYAEFIQRHSHRCVKEFDFASVPWGEDPLGLVESIQQMVRSPRIGEQKSKRSLSAWQAVSSIKFKPNILLKLRLCYLVYCARYGVRIREKSKSRSIKLVDMYRKPLRHLGRLLMREGKLPNPELIFFLTYDELCQLVKGHCPAFVTKARRRIKVFAQSDRFKFPEITEGLPQPVNSKPRAINGSPVHSMKGITVSRGVSRGIARVILELEECKQIQQDDILITYGTDIGWSPYFPLLSGVVTELGGLVSHGAVVAREYGLPCLVGVEGATSVFKSGDLVILDANQGTISKVQPDSNHSA